MTLALAGRILVCCPVLADAMASPVVGLANDILCGVVVKSEQRHAERPGDRNAFRRLMSILAILQLGVRR